jgi:hypothetical protein
MLAMPSSTFTQRWSSKFKGLRIPCALDDSQ